MEKIENQAVFFRNRLSKRFKHLSKWARRTGVFAYRVYDRDIPEIPLSVDVYYDEKALNAVVYLYKRPYEKSAEDEKKWVDVMCAEVSSVFEIPKKNVYFKQRERQSGKNQYEKIVDRGREILVKEGHAVFSVNLSDYLDTGLFLDHRATRLKVAKLSEGKRVLNLFCYTGAFSVHSALGGAEKVTSVDLSKTYLNWAKKNFSLNKISPEKHDFFNVDVFEFLENSLDKSWDIIICDPPTFSNSKKTDTVLDINNDWKNLITACLKVLDDKGILYFSSNSRKLKFDEGELCEFVLAEMGKTISVKDCTAQSFDEDFKGSKIHKLWTIKFI